MDSFPALGSSPTNPHMGLKALFQPGRPCQRDVRSRKCCLRSTHGEEEHHDQHRGIRRG